jgi:hypothetical protein
MKFTLLRIFRVLSNKKKLFLLFELLWNDFISLIGLSPCRGKIIFIAGLPKSGSTWLYRMLLSIPGFNRRFYKGPTLLDDEGRFLHNFDDINEFTFSTHPSLGCSVYKEHTIYSPENWHILKKNNALPIVLLIRDLRDVAVSLYHHHMHDKRHTLFPVISPLNLDEGIEYILKHLMPEYIIWIKRWLDFSEISDKVILVRYEDLWDRGDETLQEILSFYEIKVPKKFLAKIFAKSKINKEENLSKNLNSDNDDKFFSTARKGGYGNWENNFSINNLGLFNELDDVNEIMERCGYDFKNS